MRGAVANLLVDMSVRKGRKVEELYDEYSGHGAAVEVAASVEVVVEVGRAVLEVVVVDSVKEVSPMNGAANMEEKKSERMAVVRGRVDMSLLWAGMIVACYLDSEEIVLECK